MNSVDDVHFRWYTLHFVKNLIVQVRKSGKDDEKGQFGDLQMMKKKSRWGYPAKYKVHCPLYNQLVTERVGIYAVKD
jgi:hypothetical protein